MVKARIAEQFDGWAKFSVQILPDGSLRIAGRVSPEAGAATLKKALQSFLEDVRSAGPEELAGMAQEMDKVGGVRVSQRP